jgi:catalase
MVAVRFLYVGGWLTPDKRTPARFVDEFQRSAGLYPGFRHNHANGVGGSGFFSSHGSGVRLSKSAVLALGQIPVIGRFSLGVTDPYAADTPGVPRGMGLLFSTSLTGKNGAQQ